MTVRTLVADDSVLFRRVLTDILGSFRDVEVVGTAPNGRLAISRVREMKPDLLTLDMEMPEMDGHALLLAMKKEPRFQSIPVMMLTTESERGIEDHFRPPVVRSTMGGLSRAASRTLTPTLTFR